MITKTFKADTMLQTLQLVQAEFGANALVVSMREVSQGSSWNPWKKVGVEIVAASSDVIPEPQILQRSPKADASPSMALRPLENKTGVEFIEEERPEIEWVIAPEKKPVQLPPPIKLNLASAPAVPTLAPVSEPVQKLEIKAPVADKYITPTLKKIQQQLILQGIETSLVDGLLTIASETLGLVTLADLEASKETITHLMGARLRVQKDIVALGSNNLVCVVGASGSGKTSVIAKLAQFFGQSLHKSVTWVCADTVRMGAIAEARAFTDALGLKLKLVYVPNDLIEILSTAQETDLFLVDTPRYNPCNENQMVELGALLSKIPRRCTYLVAPATTKEADLFDASAALGIFNLDGLIITKLDETRTFGNVYNFARKSQTPLSFFTTGKEVDPSYLEVADPARLVTALFKSEWNR
jgi:flagellar biosynthesis GTPase FlhF